MLIFSVILMPCCVRKEKRIFVISQAIPKQKVRFCAIFVFHFSNAFVLFILWLYPNIINHFMDFESFVRAILQEDHSILSLNTQRQE